MDYLKIKYRNSCDMAGSLFSQPCSTFWYVYYLPVDVGKATFELIEEGRQDGDKNFIPDLKKQTKVYEFTAILPEYQFDALAAIALHDTIEITLKNGEVSRVYDFKVASSGWNENGSRVTVSVTFTVRYDLVTGCCNNEVLTYSPCFVCNDKITPSDWVDINTQQTTQYADRVYLMMGLPDLNTGEYFLNKLYRYRYSRPIARGEYITAPIGAYFEITGRDYELICFTHDSVAVKFYYRDGYWRPCNFIRDIQTTANTATVRAWMIPECFAQLYYSSDGVNYTAVGGAVLAGQMQNAGVTKTALAAGLHYFKVLFYTNNCNYGFSTVQTVTI